MTPMGMKPTTTYTLYMCDMNIKTYFLWFYTFLFTLFNFNLYFLPLQEYCPTAIAVQVIIIKVSFLTDNFVNIKTKQSLKIYVMSRLVYDLKKKIILGIVLFLGIIYLLKKANLGDWGFSCNPGTNLQD